MSGEYNLERFRKAQENGVFQTALREAASGYKTSHWMWFIFPQLKGLGHSAMADFYGIASPHEAAAFLRDEVLGYRLRQICAVLLEQEISDDPEDIFGFPDCLKLCSSMTLFDYVSPRDIFGQVLEKFYGGKRDERTLAMIA